MTKKRPKVFVALLNQGTNSAGLESQIISWMNEKGGSYIFDFYPSKYSYRPISNNRNRIVKDFLETDFDYLFMIDDDNPPVPQDNIFNLLDFNKDVIGAVVPGRDLYGIHFHAYLFDENKKGAVKFKQLPQEMKGGLQKVDAIGTGCIAIKRHVLENIKKPFEDMFDDDGILLNNDDMAFCIKCKKAGFEIWCHWKYMCSHYKEVDLLQMAHLLLMARKPKIRNINMKEASKILKK